MVGAQAHHQAQQHASKLHHGQHQARLHQAQSQFKVQQRNGRRDLAHMQSGTDASPNDHRGWAQTFALDCSAHGHGLAVEWLMAVVELGHKRACSRVAKRSVIPAM